MDFSPIARKKAFFNEQPKRNSSSPFRNFTAKKLMSNLVFEPDKFKQRKPIS